MELIRNPKLCNVRMLDKYGSLASNGKNTQSSQSGVLGTLYLTATHMIFVDQNGKRESWILHSHLASIEKQAITTSGTPIHVRCKNFCSITFVIPRERDAHDLYTSLYQISQPINLNDLYCFQYTASSECFQNDRSIGWDKFNLVQEFARQGVPNDYWQLSILNESYQLCDTYPNRLFVPRTATDSILVASAKFRSKGRLPVLSYYYKKNSAVICRCSQPLSGLAQRSVEDEALLNCILATNPNPPPAMMSSTMSINGINGLSSKKCLYVVDTRPKINAMANRAAGKGYENESFYENIKFHFFGIENIHVMRGSLQKLIETCELKVPSINAFLSGLQTSGWLKHVRSVLETAYFVAQTVEAGISVVVHCSDGWDRTAQTCSLAALLLDPFYRTIDGFQALIEKEWLAFGHKFNDRCGHIQIGDSKEMAPVFTQFIDAVWQLTCQHPYDFEFNERFLITIHDHVYSCQFGTFVANCERERVEINLKKRTFSLWALLDSHRAEYINPLYMFKRKANLFTESLDLCERTQILVNKITNDDRDSEVLEVDLSPQVIRFWRSLYNRFDFGIHPRESCEDLLSVTFSHIQSLEGHIQYLEKTLSNAKGNKAKHDEQRILERRREQSQKYQENRTKLPSDPSFESRISLHNDSSFDSIDSPLKVVQECMVRLQMQHEENKKLELNETSLNEEHKQPNNQQSYSTQSSPEEEKISVELSECLNVTQAFALEWQTFRSAKECACGSSFDQANSMYHCWCCGRIFCVRCIEKHRIVPGLYWAKPGEEVVKFTYHNQISESVTNSLLIDNSKSEAKLTQLGELELGNDPLTCTMSNVVPSLPSKSPLSDTSINLSKLLKTGNISNSIEKQFIPVCNRCSKTLIQI